MEERPPVATPTVLVADADPPSRAIIGGVLRARGCTVLDATSGDEALRMLRAHDVDVLVTASQLPGRSGLDVTRELRRDPRTAASVRVCVVSGRTLRTDVDRAMLAGVDEFVGRPFDPEQLCQLVLDLAAGQIDDIEVGAA